MRRNGSSRCVSEIERGEGRAREMSAIAFNGLCAALLLLL